MTIKDCPKCGGDHWGQHECPFIKAPCCVCKEPTILACSDCAIDSGGKTSVHVCSKAACRDEHEFFRHKITVKGADDDRPAHAPSATQEK